MTWGLWGIGVRTGAVVPGSAIFRGIDLTDAPSHVSDRLHAAIDGAADPHLFSDLLAHLDDTGYAGWWTDDPDNAKRYAGGHDGANTLRAVLSTDWNGEGQDYDYTDDEIGDDDVPLRDEPPRPHTVWVSRPGSEWVNISKGVGVPGPGERTATVSDDDPIWELLGLPPGGEKPRSAPPAAPQNEQPIPGVPVGQERYVKALSGQPAKQGHLMLPVDVLDHYKEYDHPYDDQTKALEYMIRREGIRNPVQVSTNGTHALLHEGNHRLAVAKRLGITHLPVRVTYDDEVVHNDGTPVPLEPVLGDWVKNNGHTLKSFWDHAHRTAMPYYHYTDQEFEPGDELKPAIETGPSLSKSKWQGAPGDYADYDPSKVYFTWRDKDPGHDEYTDPNSVYGPYAYEVEPVGDIEDDPEKETYRSFHEDELFIPYGPGSLGYDDYMAPNAIVKRKIDAPQVAKDHAEQMRNKYGPNWPNNKKARTMTAAVTVYTQPNCVQCTMTKKQLDKLGIEHNTVDVSADPEAHAYVTGLGYTAAPVVVVNDGEDHWAGFKPDRLKALSGE